MSNLFNSIIVNNTFTFTTFCLCTLCSIVLGMAIAWVHTIRNTYSKNFLVTLATIPVIVEVIILLVNGNLGAGVAVAGAFSLVRFRSAPGSAREICSLFLAMAVGLATGMGYLFMAIILVLIVGLAQVLMSTSHFLESKARKLTISIPESLDYEGIFDSVLNVYASNYDLTHVRTAQMGAVYKLTYDVQLKPGASVKAFLDNLRTRNGNLEVSLTKHLSTEEAL